MAEERLAGRSVQGKCSVRRALLQCHRPWRAGVDATSAKHTGAHKHTCRILSHPKHTEVSEEASGPSIYLSIILTIIHYLSTDGCMMLSACLPAPSKRINHRKVSCMIPVLQILMFGDIWDQEIHVCSNMSLLQLKLVSPMTWP